MPGSLVLNLESLLVNYAGEENYDWRSAAIQAGTDLHEEEVSIPTW